MILGLIFFVVFLYLFLVFAVIYERLVDGDTEGLFLEAVLAPETVWNELGDYWADAQREIQEIQDSGLSMKDQFEIYRTMFVGR